MIDHVKPVDDMMLDGKVSETRRRCMRTDMIFAAAVRMNGRTNKVRIAKNVNAIGLFDSFVRTDAQRQTLNTVERAIETSVNPRKNMKQERRKFDQKNHRDCVPFEEISLHFIRYRELNLNVNRLNRLNTCIGKLKSERCIDVCKTVTATAVVYTERKQQQHRPHRSKKKKSYQSNSWNNSTNDDDDKRRTHTIGSTQTSENGDNNMRCTKTVGSTNAHRDSSMNEDDDDDDERKKEMNDNKNIAGNKVKYKSM